MILKSLQCIEVSGNLVQLLIAKLHCGHKRTAFETIRRLEPLVQIRRRVVHRARSQCRPAHEVSEIRTKLSGCRRSRDRVTVHAGLRFENSSPCRHRGILLRRLLLIFNPRGELVWRVDVYTQQHQRVLRAAELRTLAEIQPRFLRIHPHAVHTIRDQIRLASQLRNPKAVVDVCRGQL